MLNIKHSLFILSISCCTFNLFAQTAQIQRILFGSCAHQDEPLPILTSINRHQPDLFIFLGDNIYGDTADMSVLTAKYQQLGAKAAFKQLRQQSEVIAIWDDHDYGANDAGAEYPQKHASRQIMLDFWQEPATSPRRTRQDGIYTAYYYGDSANRVQVILPDLRWNRPDIAKVSTIEYIFSRKRKNMGPYKVHPDANASMLGEAQWQWLEQELQKPAKLRIIGSSLQVLADFTGWEAWRNYPADWQRLTRIIKKHQVNGLILISGDTHWGEFSRVTDDLDYPLWEVTSSGLSEEWKDVSPNRHRVGAFYNKVNYGAIEIDWTQADPLVSLALHDLNGDIVNRHVLPLSSLSPYPTE